MTFIIAVDQLTRHQLSGHEYLFAQVFFDGDANSSSHVEGLIFLVSSAVNDGTLSWCVFARLCSRVQWFDHWATSNRAGLILILGVRMHRVRLAHARCIIISGENRALDVVQVPS